MRKIHNLKLQKIVMAFLLFTGLLQSASSYSQSGLITNITTTTGHSYTLGTLTAGATIYSDRTYQATSVPASLNNASFIKTPNDDKANKATSTPSFTLTQAATVYIAYDPRATVLPAWLNGWQKLGSQIGINDPNISGLDLYSKTFAAGKVTLGGNLASPAAGALNMYLIVATSQSASQYTLTVTTSGSGTVAKNPNQANYAAGSNVVLTATPGSGQQFTGWSGDATGTTNPLTVTMNADKSITANFAPTSSGLITNITATTGHTYTLGTLATGTTVYSDRTYQATSIPAFLNNAPFIKTANDDKGSKATSVLSFNLSQAATVYVAYDPRATAIPAWLSDWQKLASQIGINDPNVAGLTIYSKSFPAGKITLGGNLASPAAGALNNYFVIASTQTSQYSLTVGTNGSGSVTRNPNQATYAAGTAVTVTATPASGQQFAGWSGDASGTTNPLTVVMDANKSITATFASISSQYTLAVAINGTGTVTKNPNQATYAPGANVSLTAKAGAGQQFTGWSGDATGTTNPLSIVMNADKSVTATFATTGSAGSISVTPLSIYDNDVSGGAAGINRTITVKNTGQGTLSLSAISTSGTNTNQFVLSGLPAFPANINAGSSISFSVAFNPSSTGLKTAAVNISSNDPSNPSLSIPLRGLGTAGLGGANEPSLQALLNLLEIQANVGDDDINTTVINSNTTTQKAALLGDEVSIQKFQKAGAGNVTITPLGVFGPTANNPVIQSGWYKSGDASSKSQLVSVSNSPASNGQTVNVNFTGTLSFDPGSGAFGFYCNWPFFSNRLMFSEDNLNTFSGAVPHHVRVFPYKKNGIIVPNSYLVTFEDNTTSLDYNDWMFLVSNVKKFSSSASASNALLFVENTDAFPSNDHVVFSHIQIPWTRDTVYNANHDSVKVRLHNYGVSPLTISDLTISNNTLWKIDKFNGVNYTPATQLPIVVNPGGTLDLMIKFIANNLGNSATRIKILHETLTISSNDDADPEKQVFLDGLWQYKGEGNHEPYSHEIFTLFGFGTKSGYEHEDPDKGDTTKLKGDEIRPDYFVRADDNFPVTVRQMSAYHGCCQAKEHFKWFTKGTNVLNDLFIQIGLDGQSVLPRKSLNGTASGGTFTPSSAPFGIQIGDGNTTDPSKNSGKILGVRVYKALDGAGNIIPNTYLLSGDYLGTNVTNYDYNDNIYYISNVKPYLGSAYNSPLNVTPSDLDFGEHVLQTSSSLQLNISNGGKTYSNGSQDPPIVISSVVVTGENQSEFDADMPLSTTLNPQQGTTIKVTFNPKSQGLKIADLLIYYNNSKSPKRVPLYGIAKGSGVTVKVNYRINSGATSATTSDGKTWAADNQYAHDNLEPFKNSAVKDIAGTDDDFLYLVEQSSNGDKKPFRYQFPVANGTYYVRLHFAEIYWGAPGAGVAGGAGSRVFSVKIENQYRLTNYDVIQDVGKATAVVKNFPVTVSDGNLNIDFSASVNRPLVMAVEVYSFSSSSGRAEIAPDQPAVSAVIRADDAVYNISKPRIYPNPIANKNFNIQFPAKYKGAYAIQLVDMIGRKYDLGTTKLNGTGTDMKIDISGLSLKPGVYLLKINSNTAKADVIKLIIR